MAQPPFKKEEIEALSPDESSLKAARGLLNIANWSQLGVNEEAIWGACQGSGSKPYLVQMYVAERVYKCTCPSRKFPCKHSLALSILCVDYHTQFSVQEAPTWVNEWLSARQNRAEKKEQKATEILTPEKIAQTEKAAEKRAAQKQSRMQEGIAALELWLTDTIRGGITHLPLQLTQFRQMTARMVDAQLPGIARRLNALESVIGIRQNWALTTLKCMGQLQLLADAYQRLQTLSPLEQIDVLNALGDNSNIDTSNQSSSAPITDTWLVLGLSFVEDNKLWRRAVWLQGIQNKRFAVLLDFNFGQRQFEPHLNEGLCLQAQCVYFSSNYPIRARLQNYTVSTQTASPIAHSLSESLKLTAMQLAANPWQSTCPWLIKDVKIQVNADEHFSIVHEQFAIDLNVGRKGWHLLASVGNQPFQLFGEYQNNTLTPMSAWLDGHLVWTNDELKQQ